MAELRTNVHRSPTIGAHLIDEATPAYAPTEPPEPEPARGSADPIGDDQAHRSAWGGLDECEGADSPPRITLLARVRSWFHNL
jgi:hypothetical protein